MAFMAADADGDGTLDLHELRALAVSLGVTEEGELRSAVAQMDGDGDGEVTLEEFARWWRAQTEEHTHDEKKEGGESCLPVRATSSSAHTHG